MDVAYKLDPCVACSTWLRMGRLCGLLVTPLRLPLGSLSAACIISGTAESEAGYKYWQSMRVRFFALRTAYFNESHNWGHGLMQPCASRPSPRRY